MNENVLEQVWILIGKMVKLVLFGTLQYFSVPFSTLQNFSGGTDAGEGGVETISIEQYQEESTKYLAYILNNANDEHPMSGSNAQVTLYFGAQSKTINAPKSGDQTDADGNGYWIIGCFTGSSKLEKMEEKNLYSDNYNYEC